MQFQVLGPLAFRADDGRVITPGGARQRLLLGALLLNVRRPISTSLLIEILWGAGVPKYPDAALRTQVCRLRALLGPGSAEASLIRFGPGGYLLDIAGDALDCVRFEDALSRAARAPAPSEMLALLELAIALWRGPLPYDGVADHVMFAGEVARLRELRASAHERRVECLLKMGDLDAAVARIEELVQADPLRERAIALQMAALYRSGRQHDALSAFRSYRRLLADELGLTPTPALRQLELEIIQHADVLTLAHPASGEPADERVRAPSPGSSGSVDPPRALPPRPLTRLIGREHEVVSVLRLLGSTRMLTLHGAGGSGKTRLAVDVATRMADRSGMAVSWVSLEALADPQLVPAEVAAAIGVAEPPGSSVLHAVAAFLREREALLVLDNCEHLVGACATLAEFLLHECRQLRILATSREPLAVPGEVTWLVPPLPAPASNGEDASRLGTIPAVELFVERARAARPEFALGAENASAVAQICRRLDGLPLALELAAARLRTLTVPEIAARLDQRFALLVSGSRTQLPRQQTLRATLDWSYAMLTPAQQRLLHRLGVFAGSFSIEAIEAVAPHDGDMGEPLLSAVSALVDRSLLCSDPRADGTRFRLLESVRHYARDLPDTGSHPEIDRLHAEHYTALAESAGPALLGPDRVAWARRLAPEQDNFRAALSWAIDNDHAHHYALRLAGSLWWFWHYVGRLSEGRRWIERALALPAEGLPLAHRGALMYAAAKSSWMLGDQSSALRHADEALRLCRRVGDPRLIVHASVACALVLREHDILDDAERMAQEAVAAARQGDVRPTDVALATWCAGCIHSALDDAAAAAADFRKAAELWGASGDEWGVAEAHRCLGLVQLRGGDVHDALRYCRNAIVALRGAGETWFLCRALEALATVLSSGVDLVAAARVIGAAEMLRESVRAPVLPYELRDYRITMAALRSRLGEAAFESARQNGRSLGEDAAIALALEASGGSTSVASVSSIATAAHIDIGISRA